MSTCQAPQTGPLSSVAALQAWSAATADPITAGWVPLQPRAGGLPDAPRVLHCHSDMGGYLKNGDLWPQGTGNADIYLQPYWQLVDLFVYFSQTAVMIPTPWWINAAHRNGVPVLGTLCMNSFSPDDVSLFLDGPPGTPTVTLADGTVVPFFAAQLAAVADFYGFDGWFFDVEIAMCPEQARQLVTFLRSLTALMNAGGGLVIWYDAMTADGELAYQNVLNDQNLPFFLATNGIFLNYWWNTGAQSPTDPSRSAALAAKHGRSPFDVYTGIDVFKSSSEFNGYEGQFDTWHTVGTCSQAGTSSGLFAASWTYQHAADYADYLARDRRLWVGSGGCEPKDGIAAVVPPRPLPAALPIFTSFNLGNVTRAAYIDGAPQPDSAPFGNLSEQDPLPAWRFCATPSFHADVSFATDTAFNGGTSLRLLALGEARVRLFACASPVEGDLLVVYTVLDPRGVLALALSFDGAPEVVLAARAAPGRVAPTSVVDQEGGWESRVYALGGAYARLTLTEVDLLHEGGGVSTHLGDVRIVPAAAAVYPGGVGSLAGTPLQSCGGGAVSTRLTWEAPDEPVAWYDVYCDNGAPFWVGRAYANAYVARVPAGAAASLAFTVQPVGASGFRQPLDEAATVTLPAATQTAGAAPWAPAVAEPV
jgi:hypothetical protein